MREHDLMYLGVWEHIQRAKAFYRKRGFAKAGEHRFEIGSRVDTDWLMRRDL